MKLFLLICVALFGVAAFTAHDGDVFDKLDIQSIFGSDDKRRQAYDCLMDRAPCEKYQIIKEKSPDMIKTDCGDCSASQKVKYQELMKKLELEHNAAYREIIKKFKS